MNIDHAHIPKERTSGLLSVSKRHGLVLSRTFDVIDTAARLLRYDHNARRVLLSFRRATGPTRIYWAFFGELTQYDPCGHSYSAILDWCISMLSWGSVTSTQARATATTHL